MIIFDCNGVLVDSEPIATVGRGAGIAARGPEASRPRSSRAISPAAGHPTCSPMSRRRPASSCPHDFASQVAAKTLRRLRDEVRTMPHVVHALTWLRGPKCRRLVLAARSRARLPGMHGSAAVFRAECVLGQRRHGRQAGARSVPACRRKHRHRARRLLSWSRIRPPAFGGGGGRHDRDRLCRRRPCRAQSRLASDGGRRENGDRRHARAQGRRRDAARALYFRKA